MDKVVRHGRVADLSIRDDASVEGVREFLRCNEAVEATTIATVRSKGYDTL